MRSTLISLVGGSAVAVIVVLLFVSLMAVLKDPIAVMTNHLEILKQDSVYLISP